MNKNMSEWRGCMRRCERPKRESGLGRPGLTGNEVSGYAKVYGIALEIVSLPEAGFITRSKKSV